MGGGRGAGQGRAQGGRRRGGGGGSGPGRGQGAGLMGEGGFCLCPKCGHREPHSAGSPCLQERCPTCGSAMVREGSPHHLEIERRRATQEPKS
jgi:hypothetical protein